MKNLLNLILSVLFVALAATASFAQPPGGGPCPSAWEFDQTSVSGNEGTVLYLEVVLEGAVGCNPSIESVTFEWDVNYRGTASGQMTIGGNYVNPNMGSMTISGSGSSISIPISIGSMGDSYNWTFTITNVEATGSPTSVGTNDQASVSITNL